MTGEGNDGSAPKISAYGSGAATLKLNGAIVELLADANVRARLAEPGQEIPPRQQQSPEALGVFHKAEIEKWWSIVKAAAIEPE